MDIIVASNNNGKIQEFKKILEPMGYTVLSQSEAGFNMEVDETGTTFEENAKLKAQAVYDLKHTPVLSDDSGLEVDYLNGEPGIYSARYMGLKTDSERRQYILSKLKGVKESERTARFVCCICFINEMGQTTIVKGIWEGYITESEMGENGFCYDSIFKPINEEKTAAQMSHNEKNLKSHRAQAIDELLKVLKKAN